MDTINTKNKSEEIFSNQRNSIKFFDALKFWSKLGWISFGGPAGQIAIMHKDLVDEKRWISEKRFLHEIGRASCRERVSLNV